MSHLPFTLAAYFLNALAVLANKFLLSNSISDPLVYIFYISSISFLAVFAIPFTNMPTPETFTIASLSTVFWTTGAYFMYRSLKIGQVSRVIPIIGTLIPLTLLGIVAGTNVISMIQTVAVVILIFGMVFLTITDWDGALTKKELLFEVLSALTFALSYVALRQAYLELDFFSVLVWSRLILLPLGIFMLVMPALRRKIFTKKGPQINFFSMTGLIFLGGQLSGAASEFMLLFAISLANPALVNSLQGTQYIFLLIFAALLAKRYPGVFEEKYSGPALITKGLGVIFIGIGLYLLAFS